MHIYSTEIFLTSNFYLFTVFKCKLQHIVKIIWYEKEASYTLITQIEQRQLIISIFI